MGEKNRAVAILKNATSNYARQIIQIVIFVLLTPFIVSKVGADDFGLWSLIQATIGLLGLMDMGFSTSVVKYVAEARGQKDDRRLAQLTATFFWQYAAIGFMTLGAVLLFLPFLPSVMGVPVEKAATAQIVFALIGLRAAQGLPLGLFAGILVGYQQQLLSNICRVSGTASYGLLAWWALSVSPTIETLAWVALGTGLAANIMSVAFCLRRAPGLSLSPGNFKWSLLREISTFSLWFFLIQISLLIATRVDTIIVNAFLPLAAVAVYTVAIRVAEKASSLCRQLSNTLTPVIAELKGAGEESNIRAVFLKGSMLATAASIPLLGGLAWMAEDVVVVWMGEEFRAATIPCQLLLAAAFVGVIHGTSENVLSMTGHQRFLALATLGGQVLNLVLTLLLVRQWGLVGVAAATLIAQGGVQLFFIQPRAGRLYRLSMLEFYRRTLWPSIPGAVTGLVAMVLCSRVLPPESLVSIAVLLAIGGIGFLPGFWFLGIGRSERDYLLGRVRKLLGRGKRTRHPIQENPA